MEEEADAEHSLNSIYRQLVKNFTWDLNAIDNTNLETLVDFLFFNPSEDPNVRVIDGREYHRAKSAPSWL